MQLVRIGGLWYSGGTFNLQLLVSGIFVPGAIEILFVIIIIIFENRLVEKCHKLYPKWPY